MYHPSSCKHVIGRAILLSSVLQLSIKDIKELLIFHIINVWTPGISEFKESIFKLVVIKCICLSGSCIFFHLIFTFFAFTFFFGLLSLLAVAVEIFSDNLGKIICINSRPKNLTNFDENSTVFVFRTSSVLSWPLEILHEVLNSSLDIWVTSESLSRLHVFLSIHGRITIIVVWLGWEMISSWLEDILQVFRFDWVWIFFSLLGWVRVLYHFSLIQI